MKKIKLIISRDDFSPAETETATDSLLIAHHIQFKLEGDTPANMDLQLSKVIVNKPLELPFSIPEKYEHSK